MVPLGLVVSRLRARGTGQQRDGEPPADVNRGHVRADGARQHHADRGHVRADGARQHHADRDLAEVGGVG
jgi:hypothetical protein